MFSPVTSLPGFKSQNIHRASSSTFKLPLLLLFLIPTPFCQHHGTALCTSYVPLSLGRCGSSLPERQKDLWSTWHDVQPKVFQALGTWKDHLCRFGQFAIWDLNLLYKWFIKVQYSHPHWWKPGMLWAHLDPQVFHYFECKSFLFYF